MLHFFAYAEIIFAHILVFPACAIEVQHIDENSPTIHGYTWQYMALHGYTWLYMAIHGYTWLYMAIHGNTWYYMGIHGYTW